MITGFVKGQSLKLVLPPVAADAVSYLTGRFIFQTSDWCVPGMSIWVHFRKGETRIDAELHDGEFGTDAGVNLSEGEWEVWLTGHAYEDETLVQRITSTVADLKVVPSGVTDGEPLPTQSFGEAILGTVQGIYDELNSFTAEAETLPPGSEATAVYNGRTFSFGIPKGDTGNGIRSCVAMSDGRVYFTFTDGSMYVTPSFIGPQGPKGDKGNKGDRGLTGNGISGIAMIQTSGLDKTYRITFTDEDHYDFTVHDGNGIASIAKTSTSGVTDTYTITFTDGTTMTFTVTNGGAYAVRNSADGTFIRLWSGTEEQFAAAEKSADMIYLVGFPLSGSPAPEEGEVSG